MSSSGRERVGVGGSGAPLPLQGFLRGFPTFGHLLPPTVPFPHLALPGPSRLGSLPFVFGAAPPPLPRPQALPLFPTPFPARRDQLRRRPPETASSTGHSSAQTPDTQPQPQPPYNFTYEELHAVLYGTPPRQQSPQHSPGGSNSQPPLLDKTALQLPEGLQIREGPHVGVFCTKTIPKGIRFGPFQGKVVNISEIKTYDDNSLMWEIFEEGRLSHFIDGKGSYGNWMALVNCARFPEEQNLTALQSQSKIFYESCKEITPGQELLVWYGDCYTQFLGIPISLKPNAEEDKNSEQQGEESLEGYKCDRCGKVFAYKYYRDKHLKYTRCVDKGDRKFPCHLCSRSFEKKDRLRIHVLHVHEKHRPHKRHLLISMRTAS